MLESHFEIFRGADTLYHFHLRNQHADVLLTGHPYFFKPGCYIGIMNIRAYCRPQYLTRSDTPCSYAFLLHDDAGEIIAHGATYHTVSEREQAIEEVLSLAPVAPVVYLGSLVSLELDAR
ncbi:YegP family protein [Hymenobacter sp. GOD-10R]|uniref:YegP family protein n=1 Tax=Hymenobacter sp. GOD-10R TaxID=3093922 RepID=UPI002D796FE1|nr:YegP family protein [Hymenobacter sp. GOD-10R]WRQ27210.1 YegP family protein [Hymenobacter sp. GOD-10R]